MTTSNSTDFSVTAEDIVNEALELIGVLGENQDANSAQLANSLRTLNMMIKYWQGEGLNLFAVQRTFIFLESGRQEYLLDTTTSTRSVTDYERNVSRVDATAGSNTILVENFPSNVTAGDVIGIVVPGGQFHWSVVAVAGGGPDGFGITFNNSLRVDVPRGAIIYTYRPSDVVGRPMKVLEAYIRDARTETDIPVGVIPRRRYNRLSVKDTVGQVNQVYYDPQIGTGRLYVWPTTDDIGDILILFTQRTLEDFDANDNTPDYPQEWFLPMAWNLASLLCTKYGIPPSERAYIQGMAKKLKDEAEWFDEELYTSLYFAPDGRGEEL